MINFKKLAQIPYMADYSDNDQFKAYVAKWEAVWRRQSDVAKDHAALVRAIECTNGCLQYAFRDGYGAVTTEHARVAMKLSMGAIKSKQVTLKSGETVAFDPSIHDVLDEIRDIYIAGFKMGDSDKLMEFYAQSVAVFFVLGAERIDEAFQTVVDNFSDEFSLYWIDQGRSYIYRYLNAIETADKTNENSKNPYIDMILSGLL